MNGAKLRWQVMFPRAQYWVQSCLISSATIWIRGSSASSVGLQTTPSWVRVLEGRKSLWKALHVLDVWAEVQ